MAASRETDVRVSEYWDWLAWSLFLLVTVDMITTVYAARVVGLAAEVNPLTRWSLASGPFVFVTINLLAVVATVALFDRLLDLLSRTKEPFDRYLAIGIEVWLGLLLSVGLFVFANNLSVIVLRRGLF